MVIDRPTEGAVLPALSFTKTLKEALPAIVGEPPMTPVDEFSVSPAGNDPVAIVQLL